MSQIITTINVGIYELQLREFPVNPDCLFLSVAQQLEYFEASTDNNAFVSTMFRRIASDYLTEHLHLPEVQSSLSERCLDFGGEWTEEIVEQLLDRIRFDHSFRGKRETILALSSSQRFKAIVYYIDGSIETILPTAGAPIKEVRLYCDDGYQYSSVLYVRIQGTSAPPNSTGSTLSSQLETAREQELVQNPRSSRSEVVDSPVNCLVIGTWNVSGGRQASKREEIDFILRRENLSVVCMQEVKMTGNAVYTEHYRWFMNAKNTPRTRRGTAIVVKKELVENVLSFISYSQNLCAMILQMQEVKLVVICFHSPSEGDPNVYREYVNLNRVL
jgi:hypothetical protein